MAWEPSGVPGSGSTRTSWFERDLPAMWRALENQQSDDHWRLVAGWRKAAELTASHLSRLEQYRANLAEAWPPDRNAAAAAYVARLDFLVDNVRETYDVAAANYSTLAATVGALALARHDLKPLHDEWQATSRAIKQHADLTALNAASEGATVIGPPPASTQDLERLNNRARAIMYTLSHTLVEAAAAIRHPPTYSPQFGKYTGDPDVYGSGAAKEPSLSRQAERNERTAVLPPEGGSNLIPRPPLRSRVDTVDSLVPVLRTTPPIAGMGMPRPKTHPADATAPSRSGGEASRLISTEGVIGAQPAPPLRAAATKETAHINPIGGIIGGPRRTDLHTDQRGGAVSPYGMVGRQPTEQQRHTIDRSSPDTFWEITEGVPPVITPIHRALNADPGPTIGRDR